MSAKTRQYEAELSKIVFESGAKIVDRGKDGSGHNTITVGLNGQRRTFHFASTGTSRGHGILNTKQRLKRLIKEMPAPVEQPAVPLPETSAPEQDAYLITPSAPSAPEKRRLSRERRKEIAKRYLAVRSLDDLLKEFDLPRHRAENLLLSLRGQAAAKLRSEKQRERMARRTVSDPVVAVPMPPPRPAATPVMVQRGPRRRIELTDKQRRELARMYFTEGKSAKEVGLHFGISAGSVSRLAGS